MVLTVRQGRRAKARARARKELQAEHAEPPVIDDGLPGIKGPGDYALDVVGESHYQHALCQICGGKTEEVAAEYVVAQLVLENTNPKDNQAVRVDVGGMTVGYLPRRGARQYRSWLQSQGQLAPVVKCNAVILGGRDRGDGNEGHFGVRVDI